MIQEYQYALAGLGALWRFYRPKKLAKNMEILNNFVAHIVERALSMSNSELQEKEDKGERMNFTESLSLITRDKKVLRDQLMSTLLAARDTTACALAWLFYELCYHPEIYDRLRQEVLGVIGKDGKPTYDNLNDMKYLQYCIRESISPQLHSSNKSTTNVPYRPI